MLLMPVLPPVTDDYQTWLRIAAASTEKTMIPAITSATTFVRRSLRSFLPVLMRMPPVNQYGDYITNFFRWQIMSLFIAIGRRYAYNMHIEEKRREGTGMRLKPVGADGLYCHLAVGRI